MRKRIGQRTVRPSMPGDDGPREPRLLVAAQTPRSLDVVADLKRNRDEHLADKHRIEVIDPGKEPQRAAGDQNVATLTPIRKLPEPIKKIIGALNDTQRVLLGMDLRGVA